MKTPKSIIVAVAAGMLLIDDEAYPLGEFHTVIPGGGVSNPQVVVAIPAERISVSYQAGS